MALMALSTCILPLDRSGLPVRIARFGLDGIKEIMSK